MSRNRVAVVLALIALLVFVAAQFALGKGHVPAHKDQVCHEGETLTIGIPAISAHLSHGDCVLPIDDPDNIFMTGDACDPSDCE